jgi:hypothetical protein
MQLERTQCPPVGVYPGVSEEDYRGWNAVNFSSLKNVAVSLERYKHCRDHGGGDDSQARQEGRVLHAYLLEPAVAATRYVASPPEYPTLVKAEEAECTVKAADKTGHNFIVAQGRGKAREEWFVTLKWDDVAKMWFPDGGEMPTGLVGVETRSWTNAANFCLTWAAKRRAQGGEVIPDSMLTLCKGMSARFRELPALQALFDGAQFEVSVVWIDEPTGLLCKARLDLMKAGLNLELADIKTSIASVSHDSFAWTVKKWHYAGQAAFYIDGAKAALKTTANPDCGLASFTFLAGEKIEPYTPALWELLDEYNDGMEMCSPGSSAWLQYGRTLYRGWLDKVAQATKDDFWPGHYHAPEQFPTRKELLVPSRIQLIVEEEEV